MSHEQYGLSIIHSYTFLYYHERSKSLYELILMTKRTEEKRDRVWAEDKNIAPDIISYIPLGTHFF